MQYYVKENFYFDIDSLNQFRITGPENHLFLGITFPRNLELKIVESDIKRGQLEVIVELSAKRVNFSSPLVCDIRTLRSFTEGVIPKPTYASLLESETLAVMPRFSKLSLGKGRKVLRFLNTYVPDAGTQKKYGAKIILPSNYKVVKSHESITIQAQENIRLKIRTITNIKLHGKPRSRIFIPSETLPEDLFTPFLRDYYHKAGEDIKHLISSKKTSSFEYGTIFPRDWIESADLGIGDLSPGTVNYMYEQSMNYVSETGEGWHEEAIGEYKYKLDDPRARVDRKMIDIEPRYIIGMNVMTKRFVTRESVKQKLQRIAKYLIDNAQSHSLITFKKVSESGEEYYEVGNWRDSYSAFPRQKSPLAPYDVNCIFYPMGLKIIQRFADYFGIEDLEELDKLITKWDGNKQKFRLYHPDDVVGYALALHGKKNIPLPIAHLDESYDLFYGEPTMEEVVSFAHKLTDPDYFYTPGGPLLVAADEDMFTTQQYHGKVIWPKQSAYAVAGLSRQYRKGLKYSWPTPVLETMKNAIIFTCRASFRGWEDMGAVPELYYFDASENRARFYTDQKEYEGQMSLIQLWSAVGARRMMRDYVRILNA